MSLADMLADEPFGIRTHLHDLGGVWYCAEANACQVCSHFNFWCQVAICALLQCLANLHDFSDPRTIGDVTLS